MTDCFIVKQILVLEDLGCQTASIHLDVGGEVYNLGSKGGTAFLAINPDISIKFREYFGKKIKHLFDGLFTHCILLTADNDASWG